MFVGITYCSWSTNTRKLCIGMRLRLIYIYFCSQWLQLSDWKSVYAFSKKVQKTIFFLNKVLFCVMCSVKSGLERQKRKKKWSKCYWKKAFSRISIIMTHYLSSHSKSNYRKLENSFWNSCYAESV